jgi:hypothetical protein
MLLSSENKKDRKPVSAGLKKIYHAYSEESARESLEEFADKWDGKYPAISRKWRSHKPPLQVVVCDFLRNFALNSGFTGCAHIYLHLPPLLNLR